MRCIKSCEVCGDDNLIDVLDLGNHPMCDDLIPLESNLRCNEYPIHIFYCKKCNTAHQRWQIEKELLFPKDYHYRARMTGSVINFMKEFVDSINKFSPIKENNLVIDIGCNDGSLLSIFSKKGCKTLGIDPTLAIDDAKAQGHEVIHGFFDLSIANSLKEKGKIADYITFTNVFAHIENLNSLCDSVNLISKKSTLIVIENHYLGSILKTKQFDTFYHEHPRTYSANSFEYIANKLNKELLFVEFPKRYGGNIRAFIGNKEFHKNFPDLSMPDESIFYQNINALKDFKETWKKNCLNLIKELINKNNGKPIPAKAFPGRAAILIKLLGIDKDKISAVYEIKGSLKTGNYIPGTRIPILPEKDLYKLNYSGPILNLAWHLSKEVRENLSKNSFEGDVFDILDQKMMKLNTESGI